MARGGRIVRWAGREALAHPVRACIAAGVGAGALGRSLVVRRRERAAAEPSSDFARLPVDATTKVSTDDGATLSVTVAGPEGGPCVILVHGWSNDSTVWAPVARQLVGLGHRVVLYDQRGHGSSTFGHGVDEIGRLGRDLAAVVHDLDLRDAVLVGHSMGGMSVQAALLAQPDLAQRVRGVVLVSTAASMGFFPVPRVLIDLALANPRLSWSKRGRIGAALVRGAFGARPARAHIMLVRDLFAATPGDVLASCVVAMARMDLRPGLAALDAPVTILVGGRDLLTPVPFARGLAGRIPGARLQVLPGAGHMVPLERPGAVLDAVLRMTSLQEVA